MNKSSNVKIVPASHWESLGYSRSYSHDLMQNLQRMLLCQIRFLPTLNLNGTQTVRLFHCYDVHGNRADLPNNRFVGPVIRADHDDALIPLWQAFADALKDSPISCVDFYIENIELSQDVINMLDQALQPVDVRTFVLQNVNPDWSRIVSFSTNIIDRNPNLIFLRLDDNPIHDLVATDHLLSSIKKHPGLKTVWLDGCNIGENQRLLQLIMDGAGELKHLRLRRNCIGPRGAECIARFLKMNPQIEKLSLEENNMKDEGAVYLSHALKANTNLKDMHLSKNCMTYEGIKAMLDAVFDTSSLNAIKESNHTCKIHHDEIKTNATLHFINDLAKYDRATAIHCKLSWYLEMSDAVALRIEQFKDVPLELLPSILVFVQKYVFPQRGVPNCISSIPLKNVFKLYRNCVVPLMSATK